MDNISGNIVPLVHLDGNLSSSGDQQTVYRGYSAYQIALQQGFEGSKDEWLRALVGPQGETGVSINDVRLNDDFTLTVTLDDGTEFTTEPIKGDKGDKGQKGDKGDKGDTGNGIENTVLNSDYTLTITFTDGTSYTTPSIRGEKGIKGDIGNGIASTVLNDDYTLTLTFTDGTTYKTPSIRGEKGEKGEPATDMEIHICSASEYDAETRIPTIVNPNDKTFYLVPTEDGTSPDLFTEWVYVNNAWEMFGSAKIDLSGYLTDVKVNGTSIVQDGIANIPYGSNDNYGLLKASSTNGIFAYGGVLSINNASESDIKGGTEELKPLTPNREHMAAFYGLAKASGDTTQSQSDNSVGTYTDEAKASIQTMLDVPSKNDIPEVKVDDVQINGSSIVVDGVANVPKSSSQKLGVVKPVAQYGTSVNNNGEIYLVSAYETLIKQGEQEYRPIVPYYQDYAAFYGLAKSAGADEKNSTLPVGQYTDEAKDSIQNMLGITPLIASHETDPFESNHDVVGELFIIGGKLYRTKTALTAGEYVNEGTNVEVVNVTEVLDDTYVKNTDYASSSTAGVVKVDSDWGIGMYDPAWSGGEYGNFLYISPASSDQIKSGSTGYKAIVPSIQHEAVFYGLAKASGDVTQISSNNTIGIYTEDAKSAISDMLNGAIQVSGTDPTITAKSGIRYICGEVLSLNFTPSANGICDVMFTSGSTPTVLTLPNTVKMPEWFIVEANTTYEINIADGIYGAVTSWTL